jgi:hypothetical protein
VRDRIAIELAVRLFATQFPGCIEDPQLQQLARVVPFINGVADVEAFVALQADQVGIERRSRGGGERRLPDASFALEKQRPSETKGQEQRDGEPLVGDVALCAESFAQVGK